ncbi:MAG: tetratricopeptide repeat protein [Planctomycetota bacterium]|nr:tetratricopeptide repeat protein [Planctomycetota bacterium]
MDSTDNSRGPDRLGITLGCAILLIISVALYWNATGNGFVIDDVPVVEDNPLLRSWDGIKRLLSTGYWERAGFIEGDLLYRPVTMLSFAIDHAVAGLRAWWFHAVNVALNGLVVVLAYLLFGRLFRNWLLAGISAAVYAFLPCHTEAVAPVVGRSELLSTLFGLAAWHCHLNRKTCRQALAVLLVALAIFTKENAVVFPFIFLAADYVRRRALMRNAAESGPAVTDLDRLSRPDSPACPHTGGEMIRRFVSYVPVILLYLTARYIVLDRMTIDQRVSYFRDLPQVIVWLSMAKYFFQLYLRWLVLGTGMNPACIRPGYSEVAENDILAWVALAAIVAAGVLILYRFFRRPGPAVFGCLLFASALAPASNFLVRIAALAGVRFLYFPSLGYSLAVGSVIAYIMSRREPGKESPGKPPSCHSEPGSESPCPVAEEMPKQVRHDRQGTPSAQSEKVVLRKMICLLLALLFTVYSWLVLKANVRFVDEETICRSVLEVDPDSVFAMHNLGVTLVKVGKEPEGRAYLEIVRRTYPLLDTVHYNIGLIELKRGNLDVAEESLRRAIALDMGVGMGSDMHVALGNALEANGNLREARLEFMWAAATRYNNGKAHNNLANIYYKEDNHARAERHFRIAIEEEPGLEEAWTGLGTVLVAQGRYKDAIEQVYVPAMERNETWSGWAFAGLGRAYFGLDDRQSARDALARALEIDPCDAIALSHMCALQLKLGQHAKAISYGEDALRLGQGDSPELLHNLATAYESADRARAMLLWERFIELTRDKPRYAGVRKAAVERLRVLREGNDE